LDLDFQQQDDHSVKSFFVPHMDVLLHNLHEFVNHRRELHRCMACLMNHSHYFL
jgi:U3 small nucleolar RNA-associated protein 20